HGGADLGGAGAGGRQDGAQPHRPDRRCAQPHRSAGRLSIPSALPLCKGSLPHGASGLAPGRRRARGGLPLPAGRQPCRGRGGAIAESRNGSNRQMTDQPLLAGRRALVTGAGSGIGSAIVRALVKAGARVAATDKNGESAAALAGSLGNAVTAYALDVTDAVATERVFREAIAA